jgi:uncharacterized protein YndB with AHSA1/START domain
MAEPKVLSETSLQLERSIPAAPEEVYAAWIDPKIMMRWYCPAGFTNVIHQADGRVGGGYRIEMRKPDGGVHLVHGTYKELVPAKRIVFTWRWETSELDTLVTVDLAPEGKGTKLTLTHEQLPDAKSRDSHAKGWVGCLDHLSQAF